MLCILCKSSLRWNNLHVYIWWNSEFPLICYQMISLSRSFLRNLFPCSVAVSTKVSCFAFYISHSWDETIFMITLNETLSFLSPAIKWFHWVLLIISTESLFPASSQSTQKTSCFAFYISLLETKTVFMTIFDETLSFLSSAVRWFHWADHFHEIYVPALSQSSTKAPCFAFYPSPSWGKNSLCDYTWWNSESFLWNLCSLLCRSHQ